MKGKIKGLGKRIVAFALCLFFVMSSLTMVASAETDSNDIVSTYVNLGAGKQMSDVDPNNLNLSKKDMQFLGVYISNYFIPFGTELGDVKDEDDDVTKMNKEDIKKALQENIAFSDTMAESFTETLLGLSRASTKTLSLYVSHEYQQDLEPVPDMPLNSYTFLSAMLGGIGNLAYNYNDTDNEVAKGIASGNYAYGYMAYEEGGRVIPVFDFAIKSNETNMTASNAAFLKCLEATDIENGYGFNFFDFTKKDLNGDGDFKKVIDALGSGSSADEKASKMSAYGNSIGIDCFGNIIIMGGNHQTIAVPGCMNPYTWVLVDEKGNDAGKGLGGTAYNVVNVPSLLQQEGGKLFSNVTKEDSSENKEKSAEVATRDANTEKSTKAKTEYTFSGVIGPGGAWSGRFDTNNWNLSNSANGGVSTGEIAFSLAYARMKEYLSYILDYCGGSSVSSSDFTITVTNKKPYELKVSGDPKKLSKIDCEKMTQDYLKNKAKDEKKAKKMQGYLDSIKKDFGITVKAVDGEAGLYQNVKAMASKAKGEIVGDKPTDGGVAGGNDGSTAMVRQGTLDTSGVSSKLQTVYDSGEAVMRRVIGSNETRLDAAGIPDFFSGMSNYRNLAIMASRGFSNMNPGAKNYHEVKDEFTDRTNKIIVPAKSDTSFPSAKLNFIDSFMFTDDLGAAHFDNSDTLVDFNTFNSFHYLDDDGTLASSRESMKNEANNNGFTNTFKDIEEGKIDIPEVPKELSVGIYVTYAYAGLYDNASKESTIGKIGYRINNKGLPSIPDEPLTLSDEAKDDYMVESIKGWVYYLLHPTDGFRYFKTWITNKLNSFLLGWHDSMVGTSGTGSINGTTKYRGFSGYVTTPELTDIPWTNSLLNIYVTAIPFLLVVMILIMLGAYVSGILSLQRSIFGFFLFAVCMTLPTVCINAVVGTSNRFSSALYGEKFTYWALVQHESYATEIDEAASGATDEEGYENYLKTLYRTNAEAKGNQGTETIMLKWQAPKKMSSLMITSEEDKKLDGFLSNPLIGGLLNSTYSGESYLDNEDSVYLYRSYIDIANFSRYIHRGVDEGKQPKDLNLTNDITDNWSEDLKESIQNYGTLYSADRAEGYANKNGDGSTDGNSDSVLRVRLPLSSRIVSDTFSQIDKMDELTINDKVGIPTEAFQFSIPMFNVGDKQLTFLEELKDEELGFDPSSFEGHSYRNEDYTGLAAYGLMSENPFYYFSWYLYETGLTEETSTNTGYKNLLLGENNAGFFYNTTGNGEMKDFMDMRSLFTYIIPYLKQGNDVVREWDKVYGIYIHEGVPTEEGHWDEFKVTEGQTESEKAKTEELKRKYWHNLNVARLYNIYTPWVDIMYDCSYSEPEKISYLGESYMVNDPINPASYPDDRPMIFSRSEMVDYGLKEKDLTKVEKLILKAEEGMQERMFELLNYHSFNDVTLNTAAAMNCAFEFNETFSENGVFSSNHNIYPQSFELNDFSYDAFLRFILSNTTGESMLVGTSDDGKVGNFYENIVNNSSMTTIITILILDVLAMYAVPGLKLFFIVGLFILSILIILANAFKVDREQKFLKEFTKNLLQPLLAFLGISCGMAFIVSLFMGSGYTGITGEMDASISLGDPVMAILCMIILNVIVIVLYWRVLKGVWNNLKKYAKLVASFVGGVIGSVGTAISNGVSNAFGGSNKDTSTAGSSGGSSVSSNPNSQGGTASPRARRRGGSMNILAGVSKSSVRGMKGAKNKISTTRRKAKNIDRGSRVSSSDIDSKIKSGYSKMESRTVTTTDSKGNKVEETTKTEFHRK